MSPLNPKLTKFLKIESAGLTRSFEAFSSSLAQSAGELWLKKLGKIPALTFWRIWNQKGKILGGNLSPCCVANASCFNKIKVLFVMFFAEWQTVVAVSVGPSITFILIVLAVSFCYYYRMRSKMFAVKDKSADIEATSQSPTDVKPGMYNAACTKGAHVIDNKN